MLEFSKYLSFLHFLFNFVVVDSKQGMLSILLNLLRCILWAQQWSFLVNVPRELEKDVYLTVVG